MTHPSEKLMQDLKAVVADTEDLIKATASQTGEHVEKVRARAEQSLRAARAGLQSAGVQIDRQVREHPWTAVGVAAGLGLVLGILLARK